jgi:hypothetical protein
MRKPNFEQELRNWLSGERDFKQAPPEILAAVYGMHKMMQGMPKKKAGVPLKENTRRNQGSNIKSQPRSGMGREGSNPLDQL